MAKLIDEFRRGWQGISQPSLPFSIGFAILCLALATLGRLGLAQIRPDVFFTPYFPAVVITTVFGGVRIGILTAIASGALGVGINFGETTAEFGANCTAGDLLGRVRRGDLGGGALPLDRRA